MQRMLPQVPVNGLHIWFAAQTINAHGLLLFRPDSINKTNVTVTWLTKRYCGVGILQD